MIFKLFGGYNTNNRDIYSTFRLKLSDCMGVQASYLYPLNNFSPFSVPNIYISINPSIYHSIKAMKAIPIPLTLTTGDHPVKVMH